MIIEVQQPESEALIEQRMATGAFASIEDLLLQSLEASPVAQSLKRDDEPQASPKKRAGRDLIDAMQSMPYRDIDIEPVRPRMPIRDGAF